MIQEARMLPSLQFAAGIGYRESGPRDAPALVLLHGIGSTSSVWRRQFGPLGVRHRVLAWDAPGYADSKPLAPELPHAGDYARALGDWLDALGVAKSVLVTSSWGTLIALAFAGAHPQRVRAMVLGGPTAGWGAQPAGEREKRIAERIARIRSLGPQAMREQDAPELVAPGTGEDVLRLLRDSGESLTVAGYAQATHVLGNSDGTSMIRGLDCPVLVIVGSADRRTPPETNAKRLAAAARRATLEVFPDCGHLPQLEYPERFNRAVLDYILHCT
jgi:pimeloyl-ACP methyl ester carboxylesterase